MTRERLWPSVLIGWVIAAAVLLAIAARAIGHLWFPDPDDAMRLAQVRDWLGGQSWWDVGQHRLNGGDFPMHWSRLVDLPLAAVMLLFDPLVGKPAADSIAAAGIPLLTLLAVMAGAARLTRRLAGIDAARLSVLLVPLSIPLLYQLEPLRIDHHGWQVALSVAAVTVLFERADARAGAIAGVCLAMLVTISLEGLPIAAAIAGLAVLAAVFEPARRGQALALVWSVVLVATVLQIATRGPGMFVPACDAMSPVWLAGLAVASVGATIALLPARRVVVQFALLAATGVAALVMLRLVAPACLAGPFATLDPLVRANWYDRVSEGLPIWEQPPAWGVITLGFPIVGLVGSALALRTAQGEARRRWIVLLALLGIAFVLTLLVQRTGATTSALAVPGGAWLLYAMLVRARRIRSVPLRTLATAGALIAATPGMALGFFTNIATGKTAFAAAVAKVSFTLRVPCTHAHELVDLRALPDARLFAPVDITPALLAWTGHSAIAGGYHRGAGAIHKVFAAFMGSPEQAHAIIVASGARYVVGCPGENETELYKINAPRGLWSRLERGQRFDWLEPVALGNSPVLVWRVRDPAQRLLPQDAPPP